MSIDFRLRQALSGHFRDGVLHIMEPGQPLPTCSVLISKCLHPPRLSSRLSHCIAVFSTHRASTAHSEHPGAYRPYRSPPSRPAPAIMRAAPAEKTLARLSQPRGMTVYSHVAFLTTFCDDGTVINSKSGRGSYSTVGGLGGFTSVWPQLASAVFASLRGGVRSLLLVLVTGIRPSNGARRATTSTCENQRL